MGHGTMVRAAGDADADNLAAHIVASQQRPGGTRRARQPRLRLCTLMIQESTANPDRTTPNLHHLQNLHQICTSQADPAPVDFLDVTVKLEEGNLETDLFSKPTDSKTYLHFESDHPRHTKRAIPFGLGVRLKRICSREKDFKRHRTELQDRLEERGYPEHLIKEQLKKADSQNSVRHCEPAAGDGGKSDRVPLVLTYSQYLPDVRKVLQKKRHILHNSRKLKTIFPEDPLVAFRRGTNLRDQLVHKKTRRAVYGSRRVEESCGKCCVICSRMYRGEGTVQGRHNRCFYDITIGCKSSNVIYGVWCDKCQEVVYVGETGGVIYARIQNHLSSIRSANPSVDLPVRRHFLAPDHSLMT